MSAPGPTRRIAATFDKVVADAVIAEGVSHVFGLMGAGTIELSHHLAEAGMTMHAARHESGTVGAADGFARVTGEVGVCAVTWGPAVTNSATALTTALRGASRVVLIAADSSTMPPERQPFAAGTQAIDQALFFAALNVPVIRAQPSTAGADVARAFSHARRHATPIVLLLPMEYLGRPAQSTQPAHDPPDRWAPPADEGELSAAVALLRESDRPVILAGRGAFEADARDALVRLADRTGALLATTLRGIGLFDGHPYNAGVAGGFSPPVPADLLGQADCVVAFGAGLNRFTMKSGQLFTGAKIVQIDTDPTTFHRFYPADVAVCGDARELAEAMLERLEGHPASTAMRDRADAVSLGPSSLRFDIPDSSRPGALDPRAVCRRLDALLPADRTVVVDTGQLCEYPVESMTFRSPDSLLWMMDFGAVGSGLGPAIGATIGRPDRLTVLLVGDGGLFMTLGDLDLAIRDKVPLLVVCMNDRAYGSEMYHMIEMGLPVDAAFFETPPLDGVARALGADAERITDLDQLDALADRIGSLSGPLFLDCILTQDPIPTPLRAHA